MKNKYIQLDALSAKGVKRVFEVPDGYLDALDDQIFNKIGIGVVPRKTIFAYLKPWLSMAAAFIGLLFVYQLTFVWLYDGNSDFISELSVEDVMLYGISEYDMVSYMVDNDIALKSDEFVFEGLSDGVIEEVILF